MFHVGRLSTVDLDEDITPEEVKANAALAAVSLVLHIKGKSKLRCLGEVLGCQRML